MMPSRPAVGRIVSQAVGQHGSWAWGWYPDDDRAGPAPLKVVLRCAAAKGGDMTIEETRPDTLDDDAITAWRYLTALADGYAETLGIVGGRLANGLTP